MFPQIDITLVALRQVIFVCDISGSMSSTDGGNSCAEYKWIKDSGGLDNRLGALYAAIHKFIDIRVAKGIDAQFPNSKLLDLL